MMKKRYNVRWYSASLTTIANVDIMATSLHNAKQAADKTGRQLGVSNCRRDIYEGSNKVA